MKLNLRAPCAAVGVAMTLGLASAVSVYADPSNTESFQGCIEMHEMDALTIDTSAGKVQFNLTRMSPSMMNLNPGECVTVRAYPGAGSEVSMWFAESIEEGDERLETTGREITKESTSDSPAKAKKKSDDD